MNENKRLLKNTGLIAVGSLGAKVMSFLLLPLYTSILSTEEYGTYDFIVAVCAFLIPVVTLSMNEAMFRFIIDGEEDDDNFRIVVSHSFVIQICGIIVLGIILFFISCIYNPTNCCYIWIYVGANSLYAFSTYMLRGMGKTKTYTVISLTKTTLQLLVNVLTIAVFHWGLHGLLFSLCISEVVAFLFVFCPNMLWKHISIRHLSLKKAKVMLSYSLPLIPNTLCAQIINLSDRVVISAFMGATANGIYSISYKFPNVIETIYHYFFLAWSESASRVVQNGKESAAQYYQKLHDTLDNLVFSMVLCLIAGMAILFRIFIKGDYVSGFSYVPILTFAMYFNCLGKFYSGIYTALKKTKVLATSTVIGAILNISINVALISSIGLYAAALSTLVAELVVVILRRYFLLSDIHIHINRQNYILKIIMACFVMVMYSYDMWWKVITSVIVVIVYSIISNRSIVRKVMTSLAKKK